jgi:hypothetical protein
MLFSSNIKKKCLKAGDDVKTSPVVQLHDVNVWRRRGDFKVGWSSFFFLNQVDLRFDAVITK